MPNIRNAHVHRPATYSADTRSSSPPSWPKEEIDSLRKELCRRVPARNDTFWQSHKVWIGCTEIKPCQGHAPGAAVKNLEIRITVVGNATAPDVWDYYMVRRNELLDVLSRADNNQRLQISDVRIVRGSVEIIVLVSFFKAAVTIGSALASFFGNYQQTKSGFHSAMTDLDSFIDGVVSGLNELFRVFGF